MRSPILSSALALLVPVSVVLAAHPESVPHVTGHTFVEPVPVDDRPPSADTVARWLAAISESVEPVAGELPPGIEGSPLTPPPGSIGRARLYQYTNDGVAQHQQFNSCGQAAMATVLTALGVTPEDPTDQVMQGLYDRFPPDIAFGYLGTSYRRVEKALAAHGVAWTWMEGEQRLQEVLRAGHLAVMMLDVGATENEGWGSIGGHWTVIYAMDSEHVHLSNWPIDDRCTWANLRRGWDTLMTRAFYAAPPWRSVRWFLVPHRATVAP